MRYAIAICVLAAVTDRAARQFTHGSVQLAIYALDTILVGAAAVLWWRATHHP